MEYLDVRTIDVNGRTVTLTIAPDHDTTPMEADCYDAGDIAAWRADDWRYVVVTVQDVNGETSSMGGVEYGQIGERNIDTDSIVNDPYMTVTDNDADRTQTTYTMAECLAADLP